MKSFFCKSLIFLLVFTLGLSPRMVSMALAQDAKDSDAAPDEEIHAIQQLAKKGYLGDKKDFYLSAKTLSEDDITDALLKINDLLFQVDLKGLKPGEGAYKLGDLKILLKLSQDKADDIRGRKVSAWKFTNLLKKMITALTPPDPDVTPAATPAEEPASAPASTTGSTNPPPATATATPVSGPNQAEWDEMKGTIRELTKKVGDLQDAFDKKVDIIQKSNEDIKAANTEIKAANADNLEQLKLVKRLLDRVQDDLKKTDERLDQVAEKASQKSVTDTELQQELNIMHKDLRDNSQDVSILKQEVAKLDKSGSDAAQSPLDAALSSKWLSGGALLVGLTALIISLTRK